MAAATKSECQLMGGFRRNGIGKKDKNGLNDTGHSLLIDPSTQTYSDATLQGPRPDDSLSKSSPPPLTATVSFINNPKNWRILIASAIVLILLLLIWVFLLTPVIFRPRKISSSDVTDEHPPNLTHTIENGSSGAKFSTGRRKDVFISAIHNFPLDPSFDIQHAPNVKIDLSTDSHEEESSSLDVVFDQIDLPSENFTSFELIGEISKMEFGSEYNQNSSIAPTETTSASPLSSITSNANANKDDEPSTTVLAPLNSSSSEPKDDDEDDLYWMIKKPPVLTFGQKTKTERTKTKQPQLSMRAVHLTYRKEGTKAGNADKNNQKPFEGISGEENRTTEIEDELNEIIDSIEEGSSNVGGGNAVKNSGSGDKGAKSDDDIEPVVVPLDIDYDDLLNNARPKDIDIEPVWRRKPPDEYDGRIGRRKKAQPVLFGKPLDLQSLPLLSKNSEKARKRRKAPTLVTALLDIGRGKWQFFTRHFDQYLDFLKNLLLSIENNIIIYCDESVVLYLVNLGYKLDWSRIQIVQITLIDLPFFRWKEEIEQIIAREQTNWPKQWDEKMKTHPEALSAEYDILVNSKSYFLYNATQISRFGISDNKSNGDIFAWVDAGFGHGSKTTFPKELWTPDLKPLLGKITVIQLNYKERIEKYTIDMIYRKQKSVVSGGFLIGDSISIKRFHVFFLQVFMSLLDSGRVDDDQTTLLMTIREYRSTFSLIYGGWFDAFKILPSQNQTGN